MKILFVTPYYKPSIGGVQQYVESLVEAYKDEHEVVVVTTALSSAQPAHEIVDGVSIYRLPVLFTLANTPYHPRWKTMFKVIYRTEQPDVINAHGPVPWFADIAERANKARHPFVLTYHAGSMKKGSLAPDLLIGAYERHVLPKTLRSASRLVAVYPDFLRRILGNSRELKHITPGIDIERFKPEQTVKQHDLLFVGRLEQSSAWKGVTVAIETIAELEHRGRPTTLAIAGDGDAKAEYIAYARKLGVERSVTFLGALNQDILRDTYFSSKLVILPSTTEAESFGMVVAEAGACGVPAIGSNIGGIPHVIDDGTSGLLAEPGNAKAFADTAMLLLDNDRLRATYGAAARRRVVHNFSIDMMCQNIFAVLDAARHSPYPKNLQIVAYYPPALGGMERVAENVAVELAEAGETVEVVTSNIGYESGFEDVKKTGYHVTRLFGRMVGGLPVVPTLFLHLLRQPRGSLYHVHVAQAFMPEIALLASKIRGGSFVAHFHLDVVASGRFGAVFRFYKKLLFPVMLRNADRVIVFSEDQAELVRKKYAVAQRRIHILPNGIRRGFERTDPRQTFGDKPRLLFVGRLSQQKNISYLLQALEGVSDKFVTRIIGDGDLRGSLEHQARELHLENIEFVGRKDGDDLWREYNEADVFVLPSEREGMPLVLIDAMAMRLPAIGTDVLGTRDMIQDGKNGRLVPLDQPQLFRDALERIISSEHEYARMSQEAYESVRELAWPHLTRRLVREVYP
jgi:glycosyltransferase involved in cell wall biosynthesis